MDKRITLRINTDELKTLDEFLEKHSIRNRSKFIRDALLWYINHNEEDINNCIYLIPPYTKLTMCLQEYVDYGYFDDLGELYTYIFNELYKGGELQRILESYVRGVHATRLMNMIESHFESEWIYFLYYT